MLELLNEMFIFLFRFTSDTGIYHTKLILKDFTNYILLNRIIVFNNV